MTVNFTEFITFEIGSEVIGSSMAFFATHPIPAANPVNVADRKKVSLHWLYSNRKPQRGKP